MGRHRSLLRWRGERTFIAQALEDHAAHQLVKHRRAPHILVREILFRTEGQLRVGLSGGNVIAFSSTLWHWRFWRRHDWLAGTAIQYKDVAGFRWRVDNRYGVAIFVGDVSQRRL